MDFLIHFRRVRIRERLSISWQRLTEFFYRKILATSKEEPFKPSLVRAVLLFIKFPLGLNYISRYSSGFDPAIALLFYSLVLVISRMLMSIPREVWVGTGALSMPVPTALIRTVSTPTPILKIVTPTTPTPILVVSTPTISPTMTPTPMIPTPTPTLPEFHLGYSYYYPPLGGVNCHSANWQDGKCADTTASGLRWSDYLGKGVALGYPILDVCPLLSYIYVPFFGKYYRVVDICPACGDRFIDFLDDSQALPWGEELEIICYPNRE